MCRLLCLGGKEETNPSCKFYGVKGTRCYTSKYAPVENNFLDESNCETNCPDYNREQKCGGNNADGDEVNMMVYMIPKRVFPG